MKLQAALDYMDATLSNHFLLTTDKGTQVRARQGLVILLALHITDKQWDDVHASIVECDEDGELI